MDCEKLGRLILQLRKEKGLTQQEIAAQLNISNKTVSIWECGKGAPDVSLWEGLSAVLGADILKLLQGCCRETGKTVIVITHNQALTAMADRVIHIKNGTVSQIQMNQNPVPVEQIEW